MSREQQNIIGSRHKFLRYQFESVSFTLLCINPFFLFRLLWITTEHHLSWLYYLFTSLPSDTPSQTWRPFLTAKTWKISHSTMSLSFLYFLSVFVYTLKQTWFWMIDFVERHPFIFYLEMLFLNLPQIFLWTLFQKFWQAFKNLLTRH